MEWTTEKRRSGRVAASRPKALAMAPPHPRKAIAKLRLTLPPGVPASSGTDSQPQWDILQQVRRRDGQLSHLAFFTRLSHNGRREVEYTDAKRIRHISFSTRGRRLLAPVAHRLRCVLITIRRRSCRPIRASIFLSGSCWDCRPVCRRADYLVLTVHGVLHLANRRHEPIGHPYQLAARTCVRAIRLFSHRKGLFVAPHVLRFRRRSDDRFHPALSEKKGHRGTSSVTSC